MKVVGSCPRCRSTNTRSITPEGRQIDIAALHRCGACGQVWEPLSPLWFLGFGALVGLVALVGAVTFLLLCVTSGEPLANASLVMALGALGAVAFGSCLARLGRWI